MSIQPPRSRDDEELVELVRAGDDRALGELLDRYRSLARGRARDYFLTGGDEDDVVQEAMIGLYKAIRDYEPDADASFRSFARLCVTRQILTAIKAATRQKHQPLNQSRSLDPAPFDESDQTLGEPLRPPATTAGEDPADEVVLSEQAVELRRTVAELLSELESEVLDLYLAGSSYQEIAAALNRRVKSVDNALRRVKDKLRRLVSDTPG